MTQNEQTHNKIDLLSNACVDSDGGGGGGGDDGDNNITKRGMTIISIFSTLLIIL